MRFPPSFIERLRAHFLMSEVIGRRMPIKKHGREYQGLCPFHNEKTPSFTVNDEKGFFHCFGCGAHGDAIEFIRKFERLSYPETIETLAREAGIALPEVSPDEVRRAEVAKTLYDVTEAACQWFERQLTASAAVARDYLEKRGLKAETIRTFRIGYAPDGRAALYNYLLAAGFSQSLQAEAGLIIVPDDGAAYDRFRGRVIFPIRNSSGKVIAFGGRLIANDASGKLPKYLNSPETPLFKKGELLFNLDLAKKAAREGNIAVVMEGYMDVVSVAQSGIFYALATLGTAVSPEHLRLLWQLAKEPVMCLDGDAAGQRAMMRAAEVALPLLKPGYSLRFAVLPKGEDPDSYVQKNGKASFEKILMASRRLSQILWEKLSPEYKLDLPEGRAALEHALKQLSDKIADPTVKNHYASYFRKQLWSKGAAPSKQVQERSVHVEQMVLRHHSAAIDRLVRQMLSILLRFPALLHQDNREELVAHLDIHDRELGNLRDAMLASVAHEDGAFVTEIRGQSKDGLVDALLHEKSDMVFRGGITAQEATQLWQDTLRAYQIAHLEFEMKELEENLSANVNEAAYARLVELQQAIKNARKLRSYAPAEAEA